MHSTHRSSLVQDYLIRLIYKVIREEHKSTNGEILQKGFRKELIKKKKKEKEAVEEGGIEVKTEKGLKCICCKMKNLHPGSSNFNKFHWSTYLDHFMLFSFVRNCSIASRTWHRKFWDLIQNSRLLFDLVQAICVIFTYVKWEHWLPTSFLNYEMN